MSTRFWPSNSNRQRNDQQSSLWPQARLPQHTNLQLNKRRQCARIHTNFSAKLLEALLYMPFAECAKSDATVKILSRSSVKSTKLKISTPSPFETENNFPTTIFTFNFKVATKNLSCKLPIVSEHLFNRSYSLYTFT